MAETPVRQGQGRGQGRGRPALRLAVVRTEQLTPHLRRVVFGGDGFVDNGFTDKYLKLVFPQPGVDYGPDLDMGRIRSTLPPEQWPKVRTYTARSYDPVLRELAIDFVLHGDEGFAGPWAAAAQPGDVLTMVGPGGAYAPRHDVDSHLLVGDEAALPAIAAALESLAPGAKAQVLVEVANRGEELPLVSPGDVELTWLHRDTPGYRTSQSFVEAVRSLPWPTGTVQVFVHGELDAMRRLRPYFAKERQVPSELLSLSGYWRRGKDEDGFQAEKRDDTQSAQPAQPR